MPDTSSVAAWFALEKGIKTCPAPPAFAPITKIAYTATLLLPKDTLETCTCHLHCTLDSADLPAHLQHSCGAFCTPVTAHHALHHVITSSQGQSLIPSLDT